jgi:DNA-binding NarL/FixJ family response regulator
MKVTYNVLIIDDHPLVIDAFTRAFNFVSQKSNHKDFIIDKAQDCSIAYHKIQQNSFSQKLDFVILDIGLPPAPNLKIQSGEDLGILIRKILPNTKILVCTSYTDSNRLQHILRAFDPIGFVNKQDIDFFGFVSAIEDVLSNKTHYSQTIINMVKQKSISNIALDSFDILILKELSNGSKMRDLIEVIPLTKSAIDKRKRLLKRKLQIKSNSDRDLVILAKSKGFI